MSSPPKRAKVAESENEEDLFEENSEEEEEVVPVAPAAPVAIPAQVGPVVTKEEEDVVDEGEKAGSKPATEIPAIFSNLKQIKLPAGNAVSLVGKFLIEQNRPMNMPQIVLKFKELLTKNQVEKAVFSLTQANVALTLEDSKQPLFWVNQTLVEEVNTGDFDLKAINAWYEQHSQQLAKLDQGKQTLEAEVKALLMAPTDDQLDLKLAEEMDLIAKLKPRVQECEGILAEAERLGQSASEMQAGLIAEGKKELLFYRQEWRKRKSHLMEFVERVCESKGGGLRGQPKRELIEKMGVELDESVNAKLLKGTDLV
ncbi:hypothetical protein BASA81_003814 [Batrachochytrium salamandrivorans]|nr:hypothetical protein BASA81_003814 [Batrachochytrium salamandrivorans]